MRRMHAMFELFLVLSVSVVAGEPPTRRDELHKAPSFLAEGKQGLVVGLSSRRAVRAGLEVLKRGGGAVDAAMASAMTQIVDVAGSYISFAGILTMTYYDAATGKVHFLNAGFNTPIEEKDPKSRTTRLSHTTRRPSPRDIRAGTSRREPASPRIIARAE
jgi:hypothetical protein